MGKRKEMKAGKAKGVKGMHPLGCLPLWGREGVTLIIYEVGNRIIGKYVFYWADL
jgi:hypothetical protein